MPTVELFLGIVLDEHLKILLNQLDPKLITHYISDQSPYLKRLVVNDAEYIGKSAGEVTDIVSLELLKSNILSLLNKLIINYPVSNLSIRLIPIINYN